MTPRTNCTVCGCLLTGSTTHPTLCPECERSTDRDARQVTDRVTERLTDRPTRFNPSHILQTGTFDYLSRKGYRAERKVGAGGYGTVYLARDAADRAVAVKVLHPYLASDTILARFSSEAKALGALDHPGLVRLYHYDPDPDAPFLVTEFVPGGTLAAKLKSEGPLPPPDAARLMEQVARVVHYLHENDVLHRDLKPSNILLDADGRPRVADFGLAKRLTSGEPLTRTGYSAGGTPEYGAPEQFLPNVTADHRADVYALGAVLYALLTGRPPFTRGENDEYGWAVLKQMQALPPVSPRVVRPEVPEALAAVCRKAMEKEPADRYPSAAAFADELQRLLAGERPHTRPTPWRTKVWRQVKAAPKRWVWLVLLTAVLFAGLGMAIPPRPRGKADDPVADLKRGKKLDLIPENGMPKSSRWLLGDAVLPTEASEESPFGFTSFAPAVLSLCDDPGVDSFRITAVIRQLDCQSRVKNLKVSHADTVGVFWGHRGGKFPSGYTMTCSPAIMFADFQPNPNGPVKQQYMSRSALGFGSFPLGDIGQFRADFHDAFLKAVPQLPGPWRTIQIDVTPDAVTIDMPDGLQVIPTGQFLTEINTFGDKLVQNMRWNVGFPEYTHRAPLGVYSFGSQIAVKRFTLSPIPTK